MSGLPRSCNVGIWCMDAYNPSARVRKALKRIIETNYMQGWFH